MGKHIVEIGNSEGQSFKISLDTPFIGASEGSWRTIDKGFICFNSGFTQQLNNPGSLSTRNVRLWNLDNDWGIQLDIYEDFWGANDQGEGILIHEWQLAFKTNEYYQISWALVD